MNKKVRELLYFLQENRGRETPASWAMHIIKVATDFNSTSVVDVFLYWG